MIPVFPNNTFLYHPHLSPLPSLNPTGILQAYQQQQANLRAMNSLILASQQEQALRSQLFSLVQLNNQFIHSALKTNSFQSPLPQFESKAEDTASTTSNSLVSPHESIHTPERFKYDQTPLEQPKLVKQKSSQKVPNFPLVKAELEEMIYFLLNNIGKIDQGEIEKARRKYSQNLYLVPIFDALVSKYYPVKKHREDIVRYVVRKAFKYLKAATIKKEKVYGKRAYAVLCKKYFQFSYEELQRTGVNTEDEKELIEFLLPYRKNSKNRTMNNNFTSEIFSSAEFCKDYEQFLSSFDKVLVDDNNKKIAKLISLATECITNNCPEKIKQCTRLPWLQAWIEKTQEVAYELPRSGIQQNNNNNQNSECEEEPICKKVKIIQDSKSSQSGNLLVKFEGSH